MGLAGKIVAALLTLVLVVVGVLWFYGSPPPAEATQDQGWSSSTEEKRYGIVTITTITYEAGNGAGGAIVATAPNLPGLDEGRYTDDIVRMVAENKGIQLTPTGENAFIVTKLDLQETAQFYDAKMQTALGQAQGRALLVDYPCPRGDGYVITVGYGATNLPTPYWQDAQDLLKSVTCGA